MPQAQVTERFSHEDNRGYKTEITILDDGRVILEMDGKQVISCRPVFIERLISELAKMPGENRG